jgi:ribosomal protein L40E
MIKCPECGARNEESRKWCRICGFHFLTRWLR